jgi:hypothetical protein
MRVAPFRKQTVVIDDNPAIVRYISGALRLLQRLTISGWHRQRVERQVAKETLDGTKRLLRVQRRNWNDCYNVCWLLGVSIGFIAVCVGLSSWPDVFQSLFWGVFSVCAYRLLEVSINQLSVLFQTDKESGFEPVDAGDPRRLLAVALSNYTETIVWYALLYRQLAADFGCNAVSPASPVGALYFSLVTTTTVGYGDITPKTEFAAGLVSSHLVFGILLSLLVLARFVGALVLGSNADKSGPEPK